MNTTLDHASDTNITVAPMALNVSPLLLDRAAGEASGNTKGKLGQGEELILPLPPKTPEPLDQKISRLPKPTRHMINRQLAETLVLPLQSRR